MSLRRSKDESVHFFNAEVNGESLKVLSASVHFLQKIGRDLTLEVERNAMTLRALNDTKSAFAAVELGCDFFSSFAVDSSSTSFACSVTIKPLCAMLRSTKQVQRLRVSAVHHGAEHELVFELLAHSSITRSYHFPYTDCDVVNAVFDEEAEGCSAVRAKPKVFSQLLGHIHHSPEVCIEASTSAFAVRSYHPTLGNRTRKGYTSQNNSGAVATRHVNTGLSVSLQEFDRYDFRSETSERSEEIVFCTKELVAFLGFSEAIDAPDFEFFFSEATRAVKLHAAHDLLSLSATVVLATIEPPPVLVSMDDMLTDRQGSAVTGRSSFTRSREAAGIKGSSARLQADSDGSDSDMVKQRKRKRSVAVQQMDDNEEEQHNEVGNVNDNRILR